MKKAKTYKGFVIAEAKNEAYPFYIFTKEEWEMGAGCRYHEHEVDSIQEAIEFIDSY